ncbi:unnamed protein product [Lepeophtheirus salmonis]|uniref:(salmon louse) hypothetical protein n=1 Tax=Lepeophtheirus salmonis TaxID=72036 RepID=A0A7R8CZ05_LEPSM|nr:unnamed protein product [Lepeophtheirus salmonis]CAF2972759.1 unnamed protein product [Lepeophtheirus salmonis]
MYSLLYGFVYTLLTREFDVRPSNMNGVDGGLSTYHSFERRPPLLKADTNIARLVCKISFSLKIDAIFGDTRDCGHIFQNRNCSWIYGTPGRFNVDGTTLSSNS